MPLVRIRKNVSIDDDDDDGSNGDHDNMPVYGVSKKYWFIFFSKKINH